MRYKDNQAVQDRYDSRYDDGSVDVDDRLLPDRPWPGPNGSEPIGSMIPVEGLVIWALLIEQAEHDYDSAITAPNGYAGISRCGSHQVMVNHLLGTIIPSSSGITGSQISDDARRVRDMLLEARAYLALMHGKAATRPEVLTRAKLGMVPIMDGRTGELRRDPDGNMVPTTMVMRYSSAKRYRYSPIDWLDSPSWVLTLAADYEAWLRQLDALLAGMGGPGAAVGPWVLDSRKPGKLPDFLSSDVARLRWTRMFDRVTAP